VHIVRDPRDVIASSLSAPWTDKDASGLARDWRQFTLHTIRRGFDTGPGQFLQIRYEDLTRDPEAVLRVVCAFLREDYDPGMLSDPSRRRGTVPAMAGDWQARALGEVKPATEGRWRERLSRADQLRVEAVLGPMIAPLGYATVGVRDRAASAPYAAAEAASRLRMRVRPPAAPAMSPEERYRLTRSFVESRGQALGEDTGAVRTGG
jgi:hypothetical protein